MNASLDLFAEPALAPSAAALPARPPAPVPGHASAHRPVGRSLHPTVAGAEGHFQGASKSRADLRAELHAANVATVRFDVEAGELIRISQFQPAGNQCIGLYPGPLKAVGQAMLAELVPQPGAWTGEVAWDVASGESACLQSETDDERTKQGEGPRP